MFPTFEKASPVSPVSEPRGLFMLHHSPKLWAPQIPTATGHLKCGRTLESRRTKPGSRKNLLESPASPPGTHTNSSHSDRAPPDKACAVGSRPATACQGRRKPGGSSTAEEHVHPLAEECGSAKAARSLLLLQNPIAGSTNKRALFLVLAHQRATVLHLRTSAVPSTHPLPTTDIPGVLGGDLDWRKGMPRKKAPLPNLNSRARSVTATMPGQSFQKGFR